MDEVYRSRGGAVARPMPKREAERTRLMDQYRTPELENLRARAERLYDRVSADALTPEQSDVTRAESVVLDRD